MGTFLSTERIVFYEVSFDRVSLHTNPANDKSHAHNGCVTTE